MKKALGKVKTALRFTKGQLSALVTLAVLGASTCAFAEGGTTPALSINFDTAQMFTWAQTMINAMMPVVYIIMGVALGFLIINAFKAAFH